MNEASHGSDLRATSTRSIVFDVGGVLLDWDPRHLYRKLFPHDPQAMENFLSTVCNPEWNAQMDAGLPFADGVAELTRLHPSKAELIESYWKRWPEMLSGPIPGMYELVHELLGLGIPLYGITNWSAETFPLSRRAFPLLDAFRGVVVSGEVGLRKPDPAIFRLLLDRFKLDPTECVFVDDHQPNVRTAQTLGLKTVPFTDATDLRQELASEGFALGVMALTAANPDDGFKLTERTPTVDEYRSLRQAVGWSDVSIESAGRALAGTLYSVCLLRDDRIVGCARVVGDGGVCFYIEDVIVIPDHQGRGHGRRIMNAVIDWLDNNVPQRRAVSLMASEGHADFYESFGFRRRRDAAPGMIRRR